MTQDSTTTEKSLSKYVDVRACMSGYEQLPCRDCGALDWYPPHFCYTYDEGLCDDCGPDTDHLFNDRVTVRL